MSDSENKQEAVEQPTAGAPAPAAELTVQDLQSIKSIIDVASQRGSFKPNEMMTVGTVYSKLEAFLGAVAEQQQQSQAQGE